MEGENKHGNRELLATLPAGGHYVPSSLSSFSHLILTLDSPFGRYQSCRVPLQRTADAHAPGIVNYVVEAGEELEVFTSSSMSTREIISRGSREVTS